MQDQLQKLNQDLADLQEDLNQLKTKEKQQKADI